MKARYIKTKDDSYLTHKILSRIDYASALSFYNSNFDNDDARRFLKDYLSTKVTPYNQEKINQINKIPECWIPWTAAWCARLLCLDCVLPMHDNTQFIISRIDEALKKIPHVEPRENILGIEKPKSLSPKKIELLTEIDGIIDDMLNGNILKDKTFSIYNWLKKQDAKVCHVYGLIDKTNKILEEIKLAFSGEDEELSEGYSQFSKETLKGYIKFYDGIISDAEKYINGVKQSHKPKKYMKLKFFVWKKEDISLKLVSISPTQIIGAQEFYVVDTMYKKVTHFVAKDGKGLDVYRTAIISFNEKETHTYLVGKKKMHNILTELQNGDKVHKRQVLKELNIAPKLSERINKDIILLAVY